MLLSLMSSLELVFLFSFSSDPRRDAYMSVLPRFVFILLLDFFLLEWRCGVNMLIRIYISENKKCFMISEQKKKSKALLLSPLWLQIPT